RCLATVWAPARHAHHLAARCASDRGQPAPARGVQSVRAPLATKDRTLTHGYATIREDAMAAFARSWRQEEAGHSLSRRSQRRLYWAITIGCPKNRIHCLSSMSA